MSGPAPLPRYLIHTYLVSILVFVISLFIGSYYIDGDQKSYRRVYAELPTLDVGEGYLFFAQNLSSTEPGYYIIAWIFSRILEKDIFIAFSNAILAFLCMKLFLKWRSSVYIASLIILTNFYFYVLYFAAERLKFSFIFLVLAFIYINRKQFYLFSAFALITHVQTFIMYMFLLFNSFVVEMIRVLNSGRIKKIFALCISGLVLSLFFMFNQIETKFYSYANESIELMDALRLSLFFLLAMFYSRKRLETASMFIPLYIAVLIVGGERINLYGYFIFLYYALPINKGVNIGVLVTSIFFFDKNIVFIKNIFQFGNGFVQNVS